MPGEKPSFPICLRTPDSPSGRTCDERSRVSSDGPRPRCGPDEPDWPSGVSRAYYAAFHAARDLLAALHFRAPRADRAHNYLYVRLNNCGDASVQDAASLLNNLRRRRNQADYDVSLAFVTGDATNAVADAETVLHAIDALTPAIRTHITDAMRVYEQRIGDVTWQP